MWLELPDCNALVGRWCCGLLFEAYLCVMKPSAQLLDGRGESGGVPVADVAGQFGWYGAG
jgi:hypothetical protein